MGRSRRGRRGSRGPSLAAGGIVGAAVFIVGVIFTFVIIQLELSRVLAVLTAFFGIFGGSTLDGYLLSFLFIHELGITEGEFVARLLPFTFIMIVLLFIGGVVASRAGGGGAASGASIAVGYGSMTTLTVLYLLVSVGGSSQVIVSLVLVGAVYPVLFGGLGGLVGG